MKLVTAIVRPEKVMDVIKALEESGYFAFSFLIQYVQNFLFYSIICLRTVRQSPRHNPLRLPVR